MDCAASTGDRFRRVTFTDRVRGGILGQGTILLATSYPDRTAPVVRGFWVLESLLGMPPPPPPPDIPDLKTVTDDGRPLSMRAQMEMHRENPSCAVCHVRMDPLGFSLENFDALGRWRDSERRRSALMHRRSLPTARRSTASRGFAPFSSSTRTATCRRSSHKCSPMRSAATSTTATSPWSEQLCGMRAHRMIAGRLSFAVS